MLLLGLGKNMNVVETGEAPTLDQSQTHGTPLTVSLRPTLSWMTQCSTVSSHCITVPLSAVCTTKRLYTTLLKEIIFYPTKSM